MVLDELSKKNPLNTELPDTSAINGKDTISGNRKPKPADSPRNSKTSDKRPADAIQDALNEDSKALTPAQQKAQQNLAQAQSELNGRNKEKKEGSLRIHIDLDLEVEIHLTARVKGDITIGLL